MEKITSPPTKFNPSTPLRFLTLFSVCSVVALFGIVFFSLPVLSIYAVWITLGALYLLIRDPKILLFLIILARMSLDYTSEFITFPLTQTIFLTLSQATALFVFAIGLFYAVTHIRTFKQLPLKFPIAMLMLWGIATLTYTIHPGETLREVIRMGDVFLLFFLSYHLISNKEYFKQLLNVILLASAIPLIAGFVQHFLGLGYPDIYAPVPRIFGTFSHPSVLGLYMLIMFAVGWLYGMLYAKTPRQWAPLIAYLSVVALLIGFTYARIIWIDLVLLCFIFSLFMWGKKILPWILLAITFVALLPPVQERFADIQDRSVDSSVLWRLQLWGDMVDYTSLQENQLLGSGLNTARTLIGEYRGSTYGDADPHNDFLKFYLEGGFIGLGVYIVFLFWIAFFLFQKFLGVQEKEQRVLSLFLLTLWGLIILAGLSDNVFKNTPVQWLYWILLGASLRVFFSDNSHRKKQDV